eukprot:g25129.t1
MPPGELQQTATRARQQLPVAKAPKGLGPECEMVLQIQAQLQEPTVTMPEPVEFWYPKPNAIKAKTVEEEAMIGPCFK